MRFRSRGNVALYSTLLIAGISLTMAMAFSQTSGAAFRLTEQLRRSERVFHAAESGLHDILHQLKKDASLSGALPVLALDGMNVSRSVSSSGGVRTVTSIGSDGAIYVNLKAECVIATGACAITRF